MTGAHVPPRYYFTVTWRWSGGCTSFVFGTREQAEAERARYQGWKDKAAPLGGSVLEVSPVTEAP